MFRATATPPLSYLLDDIPVRDLKVIAGHLGVSVASLKRWKACDQAPRSVLLALFFESKWGYSEMQTFAHNGQLLERQWRQALQQTNAELRRRILKLEALNTHGAANEPFSQAPKLSAHPTTAL